MPTAEAPIGSTPGRADEGSRGAELDDESRRFGGQGLEHDAAFWRDTTRLREELLQTRDELIAAEARLGESLGHIRVLEAELGRYWEAAAQLDRLARSPVWRFQRLYERLRRQGGRVRAVLLGKAR